MLGWVLRKGLDGASGRDKTADPDDTTNVEQPDTPAPIFAARALKSAIFGTPGIPDDPTVETVTMPNDDDTAGRTPQKPPQGILLTPGTGTSRRKRVSFDHQTVDRGDDAQGGRARRRGEAGRVSKLFGPQKNNNSSSKRSRTTDTANTRASKPVIPTTHNHTAETKAQVDSGDEDWEEDDGDHCMHDITVDLNEPFSRSGQYWKAEFENYHQDAKLQMEKLIKYKQLAKSYAKAKDAEAIDLGAKLKEEQQKMARMERQITEMAVQIESKRRAGDDGDDAELMKDLAQQTALAAQYRSQVEDLEALLEDRHDGGEPAGTRRRRQLASPRTQKTLLETQRELRRARAQVKENGDLKEQVKQLKAELRAAEDRASNVSDGNRHADRLPTTSHKELEALRRENGRLKDELETLKTETAKKDEDTKQVLEKATSKIADLKKEIRTLKATSVDSGAEVRAVINRTSEPARTLRRLSDHGPKRSSSDSKAKEEESKGGLELVASLGKKLNENAPRTLRNQYKEDAAPGPTSFQDIGKPAADKDTPPGTPVPAKTSGNIVEDRIELEKPKWKPFIPRSPRNRDHLGSDLNQFLKKSSSVPTGNTPAPPRHRFKEKDLPHIDLLQDQFSRLGVPHFETSTILENATRSSLPPERRAAAIARIERRKAERKKVMESVLMGKENIAP